MIDRLYYKVSEGKKKANKEEKKMEGDSGS